MREHKFRGIEKDTGKFVYGDLIQTLLNKHCGGVSAWIKPRTILGLGAICTMTENFSRVEPETVGQYTGLKDCEGTEIYEGDIIQMSHRHTGAYEVVWFQSDFGCGWKKRRKDSTTDIGAECCVMKVIGNIHTTPELIK